MIGRLRGTLVHKHPPALMVDCHGVGYELDAPMSTFYELPDVGAEVTLWTHLVVREDAHALVGFATEAERRLFRALIRVSGVGTKMALAILSGISLDGFARCVRDQDTATLVRLPGVGRKTAERLLVEMRDRLDDQALGPAPAGIAPVAAAAPASAAQEAVEALLALGYRPAEASRMVGAVEGAAARSAEDLIRLALQATVSGAR